MNTEITIKNTQILRSGYHTRGFVSVNALLSIPNNIASDSAVVKYQGARIGRIGNLYYSYLRDGRVDLRCDIIFAGDFTLLEDMMKNKALYPACVINPQENEAWLSEIFFAPAEDREFDEQEPINLSPLLDLVNNIAKSDAPESAVSFKKKYDNANSGFIGQISHNESQGDTIRVISSFIPAIRKYSNDKRSLALVGRIIAVAGASPNCRQDEIEAVYRKPLDEIIDIFVREWSGVPQQGH
ncbi:hypothetical protein BHM34_00015 [Salmonella enterica subsp. enterica serovar Toucra]|nr:hypothetical protein [Salmonella enterica subsp. enterica serovar Toucra]